MWPDLLILLCAGVAGGFVGGLVGVGGGLIFAPVLFYYFAGIGIAPDLVTPLTIGTSLMCTLVVAVFSAQAQQKKKYVELKIAVLVGLASAIAAVLMTEFVTTKSWYDAAVFQVVFASLLFAVAGQMVFGKKEDPTAEVDGIVNPRATADTSSVSSRWNFRNYIMTGTAAGAVATAAGVGGGIVLVPLYRRVMGLSIHRAVGTSSATIVLISLAGVISYVISGFSLEITSFSVGYVDFGRALALSLPAAFMARVGVRSAHRLDQKRLNRSFAVVAVLVALRMVLKVLGVF